MLTYQELISEIRKRSPEEQLALLEDLVHLVREKFAGDNITDANESKTSAASEELGWPPGYFEQTFGSLKDDPIERGSQGEYEIREKLL